MVSRIPCDLYGYVFLARRDGEVNKKYQQIGRFLLQVTGQRSQVIVLPIQKVSQTLVKANLRPN